MSRTYDDRNFIDSFEHGCTWLNGYMRSVRCFGEKTAIFDPETGSSWTYSQLDEESSALARALCSRGIEKDSLVMAAMRNCPALCFAYVGARKTGAILLAANYNLAAGELALLIDHNRPQVLLYSADVRDVICSALSMASHKVELLVLADNIEGIEIPCGHDSYEDFIKNSAVAEESLPEKNWRPHIYDEVLRLCTSGTTGLPKSVPVNDINEVMSAHDVIMHLGLRPTDVTLNLTPWFHRGGCHAGGMTPTFYCGASLVVMRNFLPQKALQWVNEFGVSFFFGSCANYNMLSRYRKSRGLELTNLRGIVSLGSGMSVDEYEDFSRNLCPNVYNGYGTTETFWNILHLPELHEEGKGGRGKCCYGDEVRVVKIHEDRHGEPEETVPQDGQTLGEVIISSPGKASLAYISSPEESERKFYRGWTYTGDVGVWDERFNVNLKGRKDDMMIVSGENVFPSQIERAVLENPNIEDCIVVPARDRIRGHVPCLYAVRRNPDYTLEELIAFVRSSMNLSRYKMPRFFCFVEEIQRNSTGKKLRRIYAAQVEEDIRSGKLARI